jgi:HD-GYP domain-containing protein (c-di-GMP phosphodiesterase class II)
MASSLIDESSERQEHALLPISTATLTASGLTKFDLYVRSGNEGRFRLYRERNRPVTEGDLNRLTQGGIGTLYIASDAADEYREYLREHVLSRSDLAPIDRYNILRTATRSILSSALCGADTHHTLRCTHEVSDHLVQTVCDDDLKLQDLLRVMAHDYSVFTHALNVATCSLLLARQFGIQREQELLQIGQGALLHDIGKRHIPSSITHKPGKLTDQERRLVQQHPIWGFRELCRRDDLTWGQLMMVYQHHERCDGHGYPACAMRADIHEYARICAIVDVYDAALRDRPDRRASRKSDILDYLSRQAGRGFDEEMTRCWISAVTNNP